MKVTFKIANICLVIQQKLHLKNFLQINVESRTLLIYNCEITFKIGHWIRIVCNNKCNFSTDTTRNKFSNEDNPIYMIILENS